jgi:hypothetical protein
MMLETAISRCWSIHSPQKSCLHEMPNLQAATSNRLRSVVTQGIYRCMSLNYLLAMDSATGREC